MDSNFTYRFSSFELKRWSLIKSNSVVFTTSDYSKWSIWPNITTVDRSRLARNVTVGGTHFSQENISKFFSSFTNTDDSLIVLRPSQVIDWSGDGLVFRFQYVFSIDSVPNANFARFVSRCDLKTRWGVLCDINLSLMLGVDVRDIRVGQVTNYHRISVRV